MKVDKEGFDLSAKTMFSTLAWLFFKSYIIQYNILYTFLIWYMKKSNFYELLDEKKCP